MKKVLLVAGIVSTMVVGFAGMASAAIDDYWLVQMKATNPANGTNNGTTFFGTKTGYADTVGGVAEDALYSSSTTGAGEIDCADNGGASTRWMKDQRAPMKAGEFKYWNLLAYDYMTPSGSVKVEAWMPSAGKIDGTDFQVGLFEGVVAPGQVDWKKAVFVWDSSKTGTSGAPNFTKTYTYADGNYQALTLVAGPTVPEPGSMLAMLSGLVGLVGYGIRRRK